MGNVQLLKKVQDNILLFPETHDQSTWLCETSMCIAGHAAVLSGKAVVKKHSSYGLIMVDPIYGEYVATQDVGEQELGLTELERQYLFYCMNNEVSVKRMEQIIALWEEGKTLDDIEDEDPD